MRWPVGTPESHPVGAGGSSEDHEVRQGTGQYAIDIPALEGELVLACHGAQVSYAVDTGGPCGLAVELWWANDGGHWTARTCHHSELLVLTGDTVTAGQPIAKVGHTGTVIGFPGDHVHFLLERDGVRVRPEDFDYREDKVRTAEQQDVINRLRGYAAEFEAMVERLATIALELRKDADDLELEWTEVP